MTFYWVLWFDFIIHPTIVLISVALTLLCSSWCDTGLDSNPMLVFGQYDQWMIFKTFNTVCVCKLALSRNKWIIRELGTLKWVWMSDKNQHFNTGIMYNVYIFFTKCSIKQCFGKRQRETFRHSKDPIYPPIKSEFVLLCTTGALLHLV